PSVASQIIQSVQQMIGVEQVFGSPLAVLSENINFWASVAALGRVNVREVLHFLSPYLLRRVWVGCPRLAWALVEHGRQPLFGLYAVDGPALAVVDHVCVVQLDTGRASPSENFFFGHQYSLSSLMRGIRISAPSAVKQVVVYYLDLRASAPVVTSSLSRRR